MVRERRIQFASENQSIADSIQASPPAESHFVELSFSKMILVLFCLRGAGRESGGIASYQMSA